MKKPSDTIDASEWLGHVDILMLLIRQTLESWVNLPNVVQTVNLRTEDHNLTDRGTKGQFCELTCCRGDFLMKHFVGFHCICL